MLSDLAKKLTVCIALALMGLVGGLGTGLHSVFDCCHYPGSSCACCPAVAAEVCSAEVCSTRRCACVYCDERTISDEAICLTQTEKQPKQFSSGSVSVSHLDCAICRLLSHFHSTTLADIPEHSVWASREVVAISIPATIPDTSLRLEPSRGPPV